jgi:hypothetical protein
LTQAGGRAILLSERERRIKTMFKKRVYYTVTYRDGEEIKVTRIDKAGFSGLAMAIACVGGEILKVEKN